MKIKVYEIDVPDFSDYYQPQGFPYIPDCCRNCNNHPANNPYASGVCGWVLPYTTTTGGRSRSPYITTSGTYTVKTSNPTCVTTTTTV